MRMIESAWCLFCNNIIRTHLRFINTRYKNMEYNNFESRRLESFSLCDGQLEALEAFISSTLAHTPVEFSGGDR